MKKLLFLLLMQMCLFPLFAENNPRIAILPFEAVGVSENETQIVTTLFETSMLNTGIFNVIEQNQLKEVLNAQAFSISACTDDSCAIEVGELLSAEQIVLGTFSKIGSEYIINAKIIDVAKGTHVKADKVAFEGLSDITDSVDLLAFKLAGLTYFKGGEDVIADEFGDVLIATSPSKADIYINGVLKDQQSPDLFRRVPFGLIRIEARKDNLYGFKEIDISEGIEEINIELKMQYGNLFIKSTVEDLNAYLDDVYIGKLNNGLLRDLPAGEHLIKLLNNEYFWEDHIFIEPDATAKVEAEPVAYGYIEYELPAGAEARILSKTSSEVIRGTGKIPTQAGDYNISVIGNDYEEVSEDIKVRKGRTTYFKPEMNFTEEYLTRIKTEAYNKFHTRIKIYENKMFSLSETELAQMITNAETLQSELEACEFRYSDLITKCSTLINDAEKRLDELIVENKIAKLTMQKEKRQTEYDELKELEKDFSRRRIGCNLMAFSSFATSGALFYGSYKSYEVYEATGLTEEAISYRNFTQVCDVGKIASLITGTVYWLIAVSTDSNKERIKELKKEIKELSTEIAALEAGK